MADHGQIITHFEKIFGSCIDHEVIKIILQACDWDAKIAHEKLLNIIGNDESYLKNTSKPFSNVLTQCPAKISSPKRQNGSKSSESVNLESFKKSSDPVTKRIQALISSNKKLLVILRGLPGSGKSTLAHSLNKNGVVLSTDDYFYDKFNNYNYNPNILPEAHNWNKDRAKLKMINGVSPIFIDNTNLQLWEFEPYIKLGYGNGYHIEILEPQTSWKYDPKELSERCIHNIAKMKIEEMKEKFDPKFSNVNNIPYLKKFKTRQSNYCKTQPLHLLDQCTNIKKYNSDSCIPVEISLKPPSDQCIHDLDSFSPIENEPVFGTVDKDLHFESINVLLQGAQTDSVVETEATEISDESVGEDKFIELVDGFGKFLKDELSKVQKTSVDCQPVISNSTDTAQDEAMYKLCSDLEDKLGKPLNSLENCKGSHVQLQPFISYLDASSVGSKSNTSSSECQDSNDNVTDENWCANSDIASWDTTEKPKTEQNSLEKRSKSPRNRNWEISVRELPIYDNYFEEEIEDPNLSSWVPVESCHASWDDSVITTLKTSTDSPQRLPHTGAVPKLSSCKTNDSEFNNENETLLKRIGIALSKHTQYSTSDYSDVNNLKIILGQPNFVPCQLPEVAQNAPLTKAKLLLHKGTMTDDDTDLLLGNEDLLKKLASFFSDIEVSDLEDVLEKCSYDLNWTMNLLIDGGYKLSEASDSNQTNSKGNDTDEDLNTNSQSPMEESDVSSVGYQSDLSGALQEESEVAKKSLKKAQIKKQIVDCLQVSNSVEDWVSRLTKKDCDNLKVNKSSKKNISTLQQLCVESEEETDSGEQQNEGSQYLTVEVDPLFASQLISIYGPISSLNLTSGFTKEVRRIVLPLEICHQIYQFWAETLEGKFQHEKDVLDKFIREDEELARKLQEEENGKGHFLSSPNVFEKDPPTAFQEIVNLEKGLEQSIAKTNETNSCAEVLRLQKLQEKLSHGLDKVFQEDEELARKLQEEENGKGHHLSSPNVFEKDPPTSFQEITNLEKALELSIAKTNETNTCSEVLTLQKLQEEFSHVDSSAVEEEYYEQSCNYRDTKHILLYKYGGKKSVPKTVLAPGVVIESKLRDFYDEKLALITEDENFEDLTITVEDPQAYRGEAQTHYLERKKAFQKAQEASQQGMKSVASYYAQIGNAHMQKFKEANERASKMILSALNSNKGPNTLDLHLLHVDEALREVQSFLSERKSMLVSKNLKELQVNIITGKGNHSLGGEARLKPAIGYFLKKEGYIAQEHAGLFRVILKHPSK